MTYLKKKKGTNKVNRLYYKLRTVSDNLMYIHATLFLVKELIFNKSFYKKI